MTELYLDGYQVELGGVSIAQTYQVNDLAEVKNQQTNFTNRFKVPFTPSNVALMEQLGVPGNTSRKPYVKIPAKLVVEGIELMPKGYATVKSCNGYYDVVVYDGNISLAEKLKGKKIDDLNYSALNHYLDIDTFKASLSNDHQDGFIHALADYGKTGYNYFNVDYNPGAIFIAWLWDKIFSESGLVYSGALFSKSKFLNSVVTPVRGYEVSTEADSSTSLGSANTNFINQGDEMPENGIEIEEYFTFTGSPSQITNNTTHLTFNYTGLCKLNINTNVSFTAEDGVEVFGPRIIVELNGSQIKDFYDDNLSGILTISVKSGDELKIRVEVYAYPFDIQGSEYGFYTLNANASLSFTKVVIQNSIDYQSLMPDTAQLDFVKDIMQHFGLLFRQKRNSNEFEFIEIEELLNNRANAEDWSERFVSRSENYEVGDYAKNNKFAYSYDDGVNAFADGWMTIDNEIIADEKTLFTSIFKATKSNRKVYGIPVFNIPVWESKEEDGETVWQSREDNFRIFEIVKRQATVYIKPDVSSNAVSIPDTPGDDVPFLDFSPCVYQNYVDTFYRSFNKLLDNSNKIEAKLILDAVDVYNLDFFKLKYIEQLGHYYYLNKVKSFKNTPTTKCELIEVREFYFNSPPTIVGNNQKSIAHIGTYAFAWADFIFNTTPAYYDPDGDAATHIKVTQLFDRASLKLNGVDVTLNQEIAKADIDAGLLQATAEDYDEAFITDMKFRVKAENNEGYSTDDGIFSLNVAARVNTAPVVNVGDSEVEVWLPANSHTVSGASVTDDKGTPTLLWTKRTGGAANISNPSTINPTFLNLQKGNYVFRLTATDIDGASAFDEMIVRVWENYTNISNDNPTISNSTEYTITINGEPNATVTMEATTDEFTSGFVDAHSISESETKTIIKTLDSNGQISFMVIANVTPGDYGTITIKITEISAGILGTDEVWLMTGTGS